MADRSLQHHPFELSHARTRQASTSSSDQSSPTEDKSTPLHPRRRRASSSSGLLQPSLGVDPEPSRRRGSKHTSLGARDKTSRGPLGNMSGSSDPAGEVTYTPTTHRISKAKKGKKVHVCEFPGCGKVFTRAEHRKRHEANHNPEPAFQCRFEDCRKPFQRADLLARHMERQHEVPSGIIRPRSQRSTSEASSNPPSGGVMATTMGQPQPVTAQAMSHGHGAMAITSIIEHPMRGNELSLPQAMGEISQSGIGPIPASFRPEWAYGALGSGDSPMYSSDTCSSPMSDYPNPQMSYLHRPPSTFSDSSFHQQPMASPLPSGPSYPSTTWGTFDPTTTYDGSYGSTVGIRGLEYRLLWPEIDFEIGPSLQLPVANVGSQWQPIRHESASPATVALGQTPFLKAHNPQTQHYLECYWLHFAPLFPIIHRPSFMSAIPQPLLAASMVVIGAQYSPRPDAKQYSASLHAGCTKLMSDVSTKQHIQRKGQAHWVGQRDTVTSRSSVSDLQTVFHLEMFNLFRARPAQLESIQGPLQFRALYASVIADQDFLQLKQASLHQTLPPPNVPGQLQAVYRRWVEDETRRRILVAMFVLDTTHSHLLQRQPSDGGTLTEDGLDLPFPTSADIWDCPDIFTWRNLITSHEAFSMSELGPNLPSLDAFQSSLLTCWQIHRFQLSSDPKQHNMIYQPPKSLLQHTMCTHQGLALSTHTPLHALLITASESWLFGTKITDETTWQQSKATLREWVASDNATKATWHATQLLRLTFQSQSDPLRQEAHSGGYLHDLWCLYVAALVCWAFGYGTTNAKAQPESLTDDAEVLMAEYLTAMSVHDWKDIRTVAGIWAGYTRGLLEWVRSKIGEVGMGGLLNGAEDVLFRLVEGEGNLVEF
ncbi:MAG: hypothetical protein L6R42_001155 [Xanthoria sp. 1 TBL-2021]|nr:MAG: hypothetical protein L6R42_001155 [Xanthoria sp. 1 TBL-2021]